jgi:hypothetical protein
LANISKFTPEKRALILEALHNHPSLGRAARKARVSRHTLRNWRLADPEFAAEVEAAREAGFEALEDALIERGAKNDTTAAIFMLKGWKPERYGDKLQHTGKDEGPIEFIYRQYSPPAESS